MMAKVMTCEVDRFAHQPLQKVLQHPGSTSNAGTMMQMARASPSHLLLEHVSRFVVGAISSSFREARGLPSSGLFREVLDQTLVSLIGDQVAQGRSLLETAALDAGRERSADPFERP